MSMGFSGQEYWSGLPFPSLGDLPHPGIEPSSPVLHADSLLSEPPKGSQFSCSVQFSRSVMSDSLQPHESQASLPITNFPLFKIPYI